jgi:transposase
VVKDIRRATRRHFSAEDKIRIVLVVGATIVVRRARTSAALAANWIRSLLERKPARLVTVAMANKTARIIWAVLARGESYRSPAAI